MIDDHDDERRLLPLGDIDTHKFYSRYFSEFAPERQDALRDLATVVDAAVNIAGQTMWPSILKLSRQLREGPVAYDGWTYGSVDAADTWNSTFVMEEDESGAGFAINLEIRRELTDEAQAAVDAIEIARHASITAVEDAEERERLFHEYMVESIMETAPEMKAILEEQESYRDPEACHRLKELVCVTFKNGASLPDCVSPLDSYPGELGETLKSGFNGYMSAELFKIKPTLRTSEGYQAEFSATKSISDVCTPIHVLNRLSELFHFNDFYKDVADKNRSMSAVRYLTFGNEVDLVLKSIGAGAVHKDRGLVGASTMAAMAHFHNQAACSDVARRAVTLNELADFLSEAGHVSSTTQYDCNDMDNFGHVVDQPDGGRTFFIRTQHDQYRIDMVPSESAVGLPLEITMSIVPKGDLEAEVPEPEDKGFLGFFVLDDDADEAVSSYSAYDMGRFETGNVRSFNDLLVTIGSMHCCWTEDHADETTPSL